jgi:predicted nucleic acid-binding protein
MPTPGSYLLDTNIVIGLLAGDSGVGRRVAVATHVYLPSIVRRELYYAGVQTENLSRGILAVPPTTACSLLQSVAQL